MKRIALILSCIAALVASSSCMREEDSGGGHGPESDGFLLNYSLPMNAVQTYATIDVEQGEDEVHSLYLLFFPKTSGFNGTFIELYDASPTDGVPYTSYGSIPISFPSGSQLNTNTAYSILLIANIEDYIDTSVSVWAQSLDGKSETEVMNRFNLLVRGAVDGLNIENDDTQQIERDKLPMSARTVKEASDSSIYVELQRALSRFDVFNNAFTKTGHSLVSVSIWNAFPQTHIWGSGMMDYTHETRIKRYYGLKNISGESVMGGLYAFENKVISPQFDDLLTTCLIVGMHDGSTTSYYRVNVHPTGQGQFLLRNNVYQITINNVNGPGAGSEQDAYASREVSLDYSINGWVLDNSGNIITDGNNILAIPSKKVLFNPLGGTQEFNIFTYGDGALEISDISLPAGISYTLVSKLLTITATPSDDTKGGYIELKFGALRATMEIEQTGATEKFIDLSTYDVPAFPFEANKQMPGNVTVTASGDWTATIFNGTDDCFTFTSGMLRTVWKKNDGDSFSLTTYSANGDTKTRYCFVLVTLDEDTSISRVLILSQNGTGDITVTPLSDVIFDYDGTATTNTVFSVATGGADWDVILTGTNQSSFEVAKTGPYQFTVTSKGSNNTPYPFTAAARVRLASVHAVYKEVNIVQGAQTLQVSPYTITGQYDGTVSSDITVTASGSWTAKVTAYTLYGKVLLNGAEIATGAAGTSTIDVELPLNFANATPSATITVSLDGTSLSQTVSVNQQKPPARNLNVVGTYPGIYGSIITPNHYTQQMYNNIRNGAYFGSASNSVCYTLGIIFPYTSGSGMPYMPDSSTDIYQYVSDGPGVNQSSGTTIANWTKASDKHILYLSGDQTCYGKCYYLTGLGLTGTLNGSGSSHARVINPSLTVSNSKILKFLMQDGPFTQGSPANPSEVSLRPNDGANGTLSGWPATMEVIMWSPSYPGEVLLGIDPHQGIVFCGDTEIFHTVHNNYSDPNGANMKFLNNLIAFMTYAAQYGDVFLDQFK